MKINIYAHRCGMDDGKENTLSSAEAALLAGADGFECDVRLTKDGQPVVIHDANLSRLTGGAVKEKIADLPYKKIIRYNYDANLNISHLEDFLALAEKYGKRIFIELKVSDRRLFEWLVRTLNRRSVDAIVISFKEGDLEEIGRFGVKTGLIIGSLKQVINFKKIFSLEKLGGIYDYVFFGWDPEEPHTKLEFKAALWYLWLKGLIPLQKEIQWLVFTGIAKDRKDVAYLRKWGFTNIFTDTLKK